MSRIRSTEAVIRRKSCIIFNVTVVAGEIYQTSYARTASV